MRSIGFYNKESLKAIRNAKKKGIIKAETFEEILNDICDVNNEEQANSLYIRILKYIGESVMSNL